MAPKTSLIRQSSSQTESRSTTTTDLVSSIPTPSRSFGKKKPTAVPKQAATKTQQVIGLLKRKPGVSIEELQEVTGWQAHSIRGLLSGALRKRHCLTITSIVGRDGTRMYRIKVDGE